MEDIEEMERYADETDPRVGHVVHSELQREIGNNQRSYIEGMAEEDGNLKDDKKRRKFWRR
jgi:hypothetical protein